MKRSIIIIFFCIIASLSAVIASNVPVGDYSSPNAVTVTSSKKLNLRHGPVQSAGVIRQLEPGETVWVTDVGTYHNGWVQVSDGTYIGFVSIRYIEGRNGDYYSFVANPPKPEHSRSQERSSYSIPDWIPELFPAMLNGIFCLPIWVILLICAVLIAGEVVAIVWLKDEYYVHDSPGTLYLFIIPLFVLTGAVLLMADAAMAYGRVGSLLWLAMLMSFLPLLVHSCWRLEQNGKDDNRVTRSDCYDAAIGKTLGIIVWFLVTIPLAKSVYNVTDGLLRNLIDIPDRFWPMIATAAAITAINFGIVNGWYYLVRECFRTLANITVYILSTCFFFILIMAELDVLSGFNGFLYVLSLILMIFSLAMMAGFYTGLRKVRCAYCHNFSGGYAGFTDNGYSTHTSTSWHNISDSSIRSNNIVRDAREQRRTYTTMHNWTDHYQCEHCGRRWTMTQSEAVHSETHAIRRKWTEYE
ncbi:MAG: SH3 domain-containing protein [Muribaculaceae bacterium]|nr:SH3 domain-containing protein [Muribaculaceae bacterium]